MQKNVVYNSDALLKGEKRMEDREIIDLYWQRDEHAIDETANKYGGYCMKISMNILGNPADSEENVNDTYLQAWKSIPPHRPNLLLAFLGKIARNLALNRYKANHTQKRFANEFALSLDELDLCTPSGISVEDEAQIGELSNSISRFLYEQKEEVRNVFVCRYFYSDSIEQIAKRFGYSQSKIKSMLMRTRTRLRDWLEKEGYYEE